MPRLYRQTFNNALLIVTTCHFQSIATKMKNLHHLQKHLIIITTNNYPTTLELHKEYNHNLKLHMSQNGSQITNPALFIHRKYVNWKFSTQVMNTHETFINFLVTIIPPHSGSFVFHVGVKCTHYSVIICFYHTLRVLVNPTPLNIPTLFVQV